jgi:hypothetical protein
MTNKATDTERYRGVRTTPLLARDTHGKDVRKKGCEVFSLP